MDIMKSFSIKIFYVFLIMMQASCYANQSDELTWSFDGSVVNTKSNRIKLKMQNIYAGLTYSKKLYVIGFQIDNSGTNNPTVSEITSDMLSTTYWSFDQILADIFIYQNKLHINTMNGETFYLKDNQWKKGNLNFPPDSNIIYSDNKEQLVICYPSSLFKAHKGKGGCYSNNPKWKYDFHWNTIKPKACDHKLHIIEEMNPGNMFRQISLIDGKTFISKKLGETPEDLCSIKVQ